MRNVYRLLAITLIFAWMPGFAQEGVESLRESSRAFASVAQKVSPSVVGS